MRREPGSIVARACAAAILALAAMSVHAGQFQSSDGVRLNYIERGQGEPTLIFVPGWSMPAAIWQPQIDYFATRYRVIAFDPRGQGDSQVARAGYTPERRAQDIAELIQASGASQPVLVGWSLAVLEALAYVKLHGDGQHAALVLVDNSVGEEPAPSGKYSMTAALRKDRAGTLHRFVRAMFRTPQPEDYYARIEQAALKMPLEAGIQLLSWTWPRSAWRDALYATGKPVLYVVSAQYVAQAANVSRRRPDIRVEVFPDAGHALFVDQAERFNALLEGFVQPLAVGAR